MECLLGFSLITASKLAADDLRPEVSSASSVVLCFLEGINMPGTSSTLLLGNTNTGRLLDPFSELMSNEAFLDREPGSTGSGDEQVSKSTGCTSGKLGTITEVSQFKLCNSREDFFIGLEIWSADTSVELFHLVFLDLASPGKRVSGLGDLEPLRNRLNAFVTEFEFCIARASW